MILTRIIKRIVPDKHGRRLARLGKMPQGRQLEEAGLVFHEACVECAAEFVKHQLRSAESPFKEVPRERLFHEIMTVNFWALEKLYTRKRPMLMQQVYETYRRTFDVPVNGGSVAGMLAGRFAEYTATWNEETGHQHEFGEKVAEHMFAPGQAFSRPQTSFWIITHAHDVMDELKDLRYICRRKKLELS